MNIQNETRLSEDDKISRLYKELLTKAGNSMKDITNIGSNMRRILGEEHRISQLSNLFFIEAYIRHIDENDELTHIFLISIRDIKMRYSIKDKNIHKPNVPVLSGQKAFLSVRVVNAFKIEYLSSIIYGNPVKTLLKRVEGRGSPTLEYYIKDNLLIYLERRQYYEDLKTTKTVPSNIAFHLTYATDSNYLTTADRKRARALLKRQLRSLGMIRNEMLYDKYKVGVCIESFDKDTIATDTTLMIKFNVVAMVGFYLMDRYVFNLSNGVLTILGITIDSHYGGIGNDLETVDGIDNVKESLYLDRDNYYKHVLKYNNDLLIDTVSVIICYVLRNNDSENMKHMLNNITKIIVK